MRIKWDELGSPATADRHGQMVTLSGFAVCFPGQQQATLFRLMQEPGCCPGCAPRDPSGTIEIEARAPIPLRTGQLHLSGIWQTRDTTPRGQTRDTTPRGQIRDASTHGQVHPLYRLIEARPTVPPGWASVTRRRALATGPLMCLASAVAPASARAAIEAATTVDLHSHAGGIASAARMHSGMAFGPVSAPMRKGGMAAVCMAIVSDGPTHKLMPDGHLHPYRDPDPGELYTYSQVAFGRLHEMLRTQDLTLITNAADLRAARAGTASAIIAAEGADFLEGQPDRVDETYKKWSLRHLQLTHYRVNELGDIQTEPPVHGGLTDTGAEVIRRCNRIGIVVDVAHGTFDLVKRAVTVTTKPLVLSHTSLTTTARAYTRLILPEHAKLIAQTGGVIGIWPPESVFPTLDAMAAGIARMADAAGIDHVGLGTDMRGLVGPSVMPDYDRLPALVDALLSAGFTPADTRKILGGNYQRVFETCMV